jgi:hypothetical protein
MPIFIERVLLPMAAALGVAFLLAIVLAILNVNNLIDLGLPVLMPALGVVLAAGIIAAGLLNRHNQRKLSPAAASPTSQSPVAPERPVQSPIAPERPVPSADVTPVELPDGRILVRQPLAYLVGLCEGLTDIQVQARTAPYIGKWLRVTGRVRQVFEYFADETCVLLRSDSERRPDRELHKLIFAERWAGQLHLLNLDDRIAVMGRIKTIDIFQIILTDCELVDGGSGFGGDDGHDGHQ